MFPSPRLHGRLCDCTEFLEDCSSGRCSGRHGPCDLSPVGSVRRLGVYCRFPSTRVSPRKELLNPYGTLFMEMVTRSFTEQ